MPTIYLVGNAHIDPVWLWRWSEGQEVIRSTFLRAAKLLRENKDFEFFASSASFYKLVEETSPELFQQIRELVSEGRWRIVGGWWVEPDCNLPSGEAMARHSLYAQNYFLKKFGVRAKVGYNIDSFGHNVMMPQILRKSDINYYIFMRPSPGEKELPYWIFRWFSPDGSEIIAHRVVHSYISVGARIEKLIGSVIGELKPPVDSLLCFVGEGDHGGGPTKDDLRSIDELRERVKPVELKFAPMEEFFGGVEALRSTLAAVKDDLQHHASGSYSAISKVKRLNRLAEEGLVAAEKYSFMACILTGAKTFMDEFCRAWTNLLFCQFHDVLAGSCIKDAYEGDVYPMMEESLSIAQRITDMSVQAIASRIAVEKEGSLVVFNPHAYPLKSAVEVNWNWPPEFGWTGSPVPRLLRDKDGNSVACQSCRSTIGGDAYKLVFVADLEALGYRVYTPSLGEQDTRELSGLTSGECHMENEWLRVELNPLDGTIGELTLKDGVGHTIVGEGARLQVIKDESDTWGHGVFRFEEAIGHFSCERMRVIEKGPVRAVIRTEYVYGHSKATQDFILYKDLDHLMCRVKVDWHEQKRMLKLSFPVNVREPEVNYEVQYGTHRRPPDGEEEPGLRWIDVTGKTDSQQFLGLTLVNDSKYSYDVKGSVLRLTVLRSPPFACGDMTKLEPGVDYEYIDQGEQSFTYVLKAHRGAFKPWAAARAADELTAPPFALVEFKHEGALPAAASLAKVSGENVILKVIKRSEEADNWVLRLYESSGRQTKAMISLSSLGVEFEAEFKPYEIKTFSVYPRDRRFKEVNLLEEEI